MFLDIVTLSLTGSLSASIAAAAVGLPFGAALAMFEFRGRHLLILIANALLGLPPVVVGLALYLLLSRSGRLGSMGVLFMPTAMAVAQFLISQHFPELRISIQGLQSPASLSVVGAAQSRAGYDYSH
jgi:tungstate transport system permease protein